ncbi:MAG: hypothetical protein HZC40_15665 [Chloroflexi bacterium]|nr:hypothetical protein [Chloroflexota bacterium]
MAKFDKIIASAVENLCGDERLRSNLVDAEAQIILDWGASWVETQVSLARDETTAKQIAQSELARVRATISALNTLAKNPGAPRLGDAISALDAPLKSGKPFTRDETWNLLTALTSAAWKLRAKK